MISKSFYLNIILLVCSIVLTGIFAAYFTFQGEYLMAGAAGGLLLLFESVSLIRYINQTNRKLAFFVDAIRNEDTSIKFPVNVGDKHVAELYKGLNRVNDLIKEIRMESEYNENLYKTLIEHSLTGFMTIDERGDFQVMNSAARKFLGVEYTSNLHRLKEMDAQLYYTITHLNPGETEIHKSHRNNDLLELSVSLSQLKYHGNLFRIVSLHDISRELEEQELQSWHKVFVPFFTTKEHGNGIGLSFSKQIVKQHGGTIKVQSEVGAGTRVAIVL